MLCISISKNGYGWKVLVNTFLTVYFSSKTIHKQISYWFILWSNHNHLVSLASQAAWKRKIVVLRRLGDVTKAVEELTTYLDTYYTDVEGWLELADIYATCGQYVSFLLLPYAFSPEKQHFKLKKFSFSSMHQVSSFERISYYLPLL